MWHIVKLELLFYVMIKWASQEQYSMKDLFEFVKEAEKAGFDQTLTSDHFYSWSHNGGYGNFTWV